MLKERWLRKFFFVSFASLVFLTRSAVVADVRSRILNLKVRLFMVFFSSFDGKTVLLDGSCDPDSRTPDASCFDIRF